MSSTTPDDVVFHAVTPESVVFHAASGALTLTWPDGLRARLEGPRLRAACRCAECEQLRRTGQPLRSDGTALLCELQPVSNQALAMAFSDGHARGIYPWPYLRGLAEAASAGAMPAEPTLTG